MALSPMHRGPPQQASQSLATVLGQDAEVLRHELRATDRIGPDLHGTDGTGHPAAQDGGQDRADRVGLHLVIEESGAVCDV